MTWQKEDEELFKQLQALPKVHMHPKSQENMLGELIQVEQATLSQPFSKVKPRRVLNMTLASLAGVAGIAIAAGGLWTLTTTNTQFNTGSKLPGVATNDTQHWKSYVNQRFGFTVQYPANWKMGPRPGDGDGRYFTTPSGVASFDNGYGFGVAKSDVMVQVVGTPNAVIGIGNGLDFNQMVTAFKKNLPIELKQPGVISESYQVVPNQWIVDSIVQKVGRGGVEYRKTYTSLGANQDISMTFPADQSSVYLPIWNHIQKTFVPGPDDTEFTMMGKVMLGESFSDVKAKYGEPNIKTTAHGEGGPEWIYDKLGMTVYGDPVWQIQLSRPYTVRLLSGVHIGSSEQAVKAAYPNAHIYHLPDETSFVLESADKKYQILIELQNGKVNRISLNETLPAPPRKTRA